MIQTERRNARRHGSLRADAPAPAGARTRPDAGTATPRDAWVGWLAPVFSDNGSAYLTGTYSDDYGVTNGLMLPRNVLKDFDRFLESFGYEGRYVVGVEKHQFRDVLHLHGILEGPFDEKQRIWLKGWWSLDRGHSRVLPVLDGCSSYVTKYALKGDAECFGWRL